MNNVVIHCNQVPWQREYFPRFKAGFEKYGLKVYQDSTDAAIPDALNVVFANNSWKKTVHACNMTGIPLITVNRCFFGSRHDMVAIGWKGFNGDADFCLDPFMPSDRWEKHGFPLPEWKSLNAEGYILVCGEFRDMTSWYRQLDEFLPRDEVRFRPHPFVNAVPAAWKEAPGKKQDDIETALAGARVCITYDSIAGCDAAINGVPSVAMGRKSMARAVSFETWEEYTHAKSLPQRVPWLSKLAYCQWSHDEITNGEFWGHLRSRMAYPFGAKRSKTFAESP